MIPGQSAWTAPAASAPIIADSTLAESAPPDTTPQSRRCSHNGRRRSRAPSRPRNTRPKRPRRSCLRSRSPNHGRSRSRRAPGRITLLPRSYSSSDSDDVPRSSHSYPGTPTPPELNLSSSSDSDSIPRSSHSYPGTPTPPELSLAKRTMPLDSPLHSASKRFARTFDEQEGHDREIQIGYDGSLLWDGDVVYVLTWQRMRLASPIQVIDYFHGVINGLAMAQMADEDEHDILAYNMIALEYPGMVATRIQHLQRRWKRAQQAVLLAPRQLR